MRKAKIVCTIGPASSSEETIHKMIMAGMDVARLNFSHGDHASHRRLHARLRKVARACKRPLAILQDVQGPRIRLGEFAGGKAKIQTGASFTLTTRKIIGDETKASVQYTKLHKDVKKGDKLLISDGTIQLRVEDVEDRDIFTKVVIGGTLKDHKGINLPGVDISSPSVTDKDKRDIKLGLELGMDAVAISFVRKPEDVVLVKRMLRKAKSRCEVIAKIEHPDAVKNLDDILDVCDGIMVARGDLGVELPPERVPAIQKSAILKANARGKLVIVATQMLESMINNPRPTRPYSTSYADFGLNKKDATTLSGETAAGAYPLESLQMMVRIITEAEKSSAFQNNPRPKLLSDPSSFTNAISNATVVAAEDIGARIIVAFTESGSTARLISDYRPKSRIVALTPHMETYNRMAMLWGVEPVKVAAVRSTDAMLRQANRTLLERGFASTGEELVLTSGVPLGQPGSTNMLKLHKIT